MKSKLTQALLAICLFLVLGTGCTRESKKAKFLQRANAQFKAGHYDNAEIGYLNVLRLDPTNHTAIRNLGLMSYEQGRLIRTLELLTLSKARNPDDTEVRLKFGLALLSLGGIKEAREEAVFLVERQPTNDDALILLVDSSWTTNDFKDAERRLADLQNRNVESAGYYLASGTIQFRKREMEAAEASFRKALSLAPQSSTAHAALGNVFAIRNDRTNAEAEFKAAAELSPTRSAHCMRYVDFEIAVGATATAKEQLQRISKETPDYLPALMRLAQIALAERRFQDSEGLLKSVLMRDQLHLEAMLLLARLRMAQNQPDKAILELERIVKFKAYERVPQVYYQMALAYLAQNDLANAIRRLNQVLSLQPGNQEAALLLAELNLRRGEVTSAINSLTKLVRQRPDVIPAQFLLATAYRAKGNLDEALKVYENLNRKYPTNPQPALLTGLVLRQQGRNAEARSSFEKALAMSPNYLPALEQLLNLDMAQKEFDAALGRLQKELGREPKAASLYELRAKVYLAETNLSMAEADLHQALELSPGSWSAQQMLAQIYVAQNKHGEALKKYQEMVTRNTNDLTSWLRIAELSSAASNHVSAKEAYQHILAVNPNHTTALNNYAWLCLEHLGDTKLAYDLASHARELQATNSFSAPFTADTLGWVFYKKRDFGRALALIQESARQLSEQPEVQFHLGMTHYMMGEESAAKVALQTAIQLGPEGAWRSEAQERLRVLEIDPTSAGSAAVKELEALAMRSPDDPIVQLRLAALSERKGAWSEAASGYEKALQINPSIVPAMLKLAQLYASRLNDPRRSLELARRARSLEADDPVIAHTLGRLAFDSAQTAADYQWANSLLQESARATPDDPEVLFDAAQADYAVGQVSSAVATMNKVIEAKDATNYLEAAKVFVEMNLLANRPSEAETSWPEIEALLKKQPNYVPALMVGGLVRERKGDFAAARDTYENVLKLRPLFTPANKRLALLYHERLSNPQKAYEHAVIAREAFPHDPQVARVLGNLAYQRRDYSHAVQLLTESAPTFQSDAELYYNLGMAQFNLKQSKESKATLTKALALSPNSPFAPEAKRLLAELK